ncbi:DUF5134 domain-containing protein [Mycobacterium persicum]|nr:DUF5134 domain-containing protein [Mycobacterium persicum]
MSAVVLNDSALRWTVTMLFGVSIVADLYVVVIRERRWARPVDHLLHLSMSAAMIAMAWRIGPASHGPGPIVFFLLAAVWFLVAAAGRTCAIRDRMAHCYNATMMTAMAWMYLVMILAGHTGGSPDTTSAHPAAMHAAAAAMPAHQMSSGPETWIVTANWLLTVGFVIAAMYWLWRYFGGRRAQLGLLSHASVAAGTALMFTALL